MTADQFFRAIWRRKLYVLVIVVLATAGAYVAGRSLPEVYSTSSTLFIGNENSTSTSYEALQSDQLLAKTYGELIQSENVAARVATAFAEPGSEPLSPGAVLSRMSFKPVSETQLISLTAEGPTPAEAAGLANTYGEVFEQYANSLLAARTQSEVSIVDSARVPDAPIRPQPRLYAAIMFILSLFLGVAVALLRDRFDKTLGDEEELADSVGLAVLGYVPMTPFRRPTKAQQQQFLEAFRVLRTNLQFLNGRDRQSRCLAVCSAGAGEGKSTTVVGLAQAMGEQGSQVVIIEADLRRPSLAQRLGLDAHELGVTHFLATTVELDEAVHPTHLPGVSLMPAGAVPISPSALLTTDAIHNLVERVAQTADFVLIDCPPTSAGADATLLADAADGVLFVVNRRTTSRQHAVRAIKSFRQTGSSISGLIVNESAPEGGGYAEYYSDGVGSEPELLAEPAALRTPG